MPVYLGNNGRVPAKSISNISKKRSEKLKWFYIFFWGGIQVYEITGVDKSPGKNS